MKTPKTEEQKQAEQKAKRAEKVARLRADYVYKLDRLRDALNADNNSLAACYQVLYDAQKASHRLLMV